MEPEERFRLLNTSATREVRIACCSTLPTITGDTPRILKIRRWLAIQEMLAELLDKICDAELPGRSCACSLKGMRYDPIPNDTGDKYVKRGIRRDPAFLQGNLPQSDGIELEQTSANPS